MAPAGCCYCCCFWGGAVAAAGAARRVLLLLLMLLGVLSAGPRPGALATEHYSPLSLLKQELQHRQQQEAPAGGGGCSPQSGDWGDQYSAECGESSFLNFHDSDCEPKGSSPCDSLLSLNTEKILSQAKSIAEQKRFPFATDNDSTNEELDIY
ncbi:TTC13 isoform 5 [Pongo abelii]|uniref:TTC13 isoform 5 n=1 Tax=Pongo abelii TaxID=9601 RepID=A0A2J8UE83_PONAB|nr:TTC13 isoform 5 [Pongo abelii]